MTEARSFIQTAYTAIIGDWVIDTHVFYLWAFFVFSVCSVSTISEKETWLIHLIIALEEPPIYAGGRANIWNSALARGYQLLSPLKKSVSEIILLRKGEGNPIPSSPALSFFLFYRLCLFGSKYFEVFTEIVGCVSWNRIGILQGWRRMILKLLSENSLEWVFDGIDFREVEILSGWKREGKILKERENWFGKFLDYQVHGFIVFHFLVEELFVNLMWLLRPVNSVFQSLFLHSQTEYMAQSLEARAHSPSVESSIPVCKQNYWYWNYVQMPKWKFISTSLRKKKW